MNPEPGTGETESIKASLNEHAGDEGGRKSRREGQNPGSGKEECAHGFLLKKKPPSTSSSDQALIPLNTETISCGSEMSEMKRAKRV